MDFRQRMRFPQKSQKISSAEKKLPNQLNKMLRLISSEFLDKGLEIRTKRFKFQSLEYASILNVLFDYHQVWLTRLTGLTGCRVDKSDDDLPFP